MFEAESIEGIAEAETRGRENSKLERADIRLGGKVRELSHSFIFPYFFSVLF